MRIALVVAPFISVSPVDYGGSELFVAHLAEGLQNAGAEVIVYGYPLELQSNKMD